MQCECCDRGCPVHLSFAGCRNEATTVLYRFDMNDETGTMFCDQCAVDALESGLFIRRR